jgi:hypothetical protein
LKKAAQKTFYSSGPVRVKPPMAQFNKSLFAAFSSEKAALA